METMHQDIWIHAFFNNFMKRKGLWWACQSLSVLEFIKVQGQYESNYLWCMVMSSLCMVIYLWPSRYIIIIFPEIHIYRKVRKGEEGYELVTKGKQLLQPQAFQAGSFFKHQQTIDGYWLQIHATWYCFRFVRFLTLCNFRDCDK